MRQFVESKKEIAESKKELAETDKIHFEQNQRLIRSKKLNQELRL